jgi:hypothetical protein
MEGDEIQAMYDVWSQDFFESGAAARNRNGLLSLLETAFIAGAWAERERVRRSRASGELEGRPDRLWNTTVKF